MNLTHHITGSSTRGILRAGALMASVAVGLSGCVAGAGTTDVTHDGPFKPEYLGIETRLLDRDYEGDDLIAFDVKMRGARGRADVAAYADCAAAQYALIRGYGFARHLRTNIEIEAGVWQGDAVYSISAALPRGSRTIDAEVVRANCVETDIPTV